MLFKWSLSDFAGWAKHFWYQFWWPWADVKVTVVAEWWKEKFCLPSIHTLITCYVCGRIEELCTYRNCSIYLIDAFSASAELLFWCFLRGCVTSPPQTPLGILNRSCLSSYSSSWRFLFCIVFALERLLLLVLDWYVWCCDFRLKTLNS